MADYIPANAERFQTTKEFVMKKKVFVCVMVAMIGGIAFAQERAGSLPFNVGVRAGVDSTERTFSDESFGDGTASTADILLSLFFDGKFLEFSVNFLMGGAAYGYEGDETANYIVSSLGFSILGKYPLTVWKFILSPALGFEYRFINGMSLINHKDDVALVNPYALAGTTAADHNTFMIKGGGLFDFALTDRLYLCGSILFSFSVVGADSKLNDLVKTTTGSYSSWIPHLGAQIQVGIGYNL